MVFEGRQVTAVNPRSAYFVPPPLFSAAFNLTSLTSLSHPRSHSLYSVLFVVSSYTSTSTLLLPILPRLHRGPSSLPQRGFLFVGVSSSGFPCPTLQATAHHLQCNPGQSPNGSCGCAYLSLRLTAPVVHHAVYPKRCRQRNCQEKRPEACE